jgi:uncharacterized membrane protein YgdD (TMEM256/DUF423 family)
MLSNYPKVRLAIYLIALAIGLAAIILEPRVGPEWRQALDDGSQYLMAAALALAAGARALNAPTVVTASTRAEAREARKELGT